MVHVCFYKSQKSFSALRQPLPEAKTAQAHSSEECVLICPRLSKPARPPAFRRAELTAKNFFGSDECHKVEEVSKLFFSRRKNQVRVLSKLKILFLAAATFLLTAQGLLFAGLSIPEKPSGYVTDLAGLLSPSEKTRLENELSSYEAKTTHQIVLLTLPSLDGEVLEDVAIRTAEKWKPGQKGRDNGVLLLVAVQEHEVRIEVGYGLEPHLTDLTAGRIIRNIMVPHFRAQEPALAIQTGVSAIMQTIAGADLPELAQEDMADGDRILANALGWVLALMGILFVIDLSRYGSFFVSHRSDQKKYSFLEWFFIFSLLLAVVTTLFKILVQVALSSRGGYYGSGRGSSGGGFSGGGGSFGGGGASGRW